MGMNACGKGAIQLKCVLAILRGTAREQSAFGRSKVGLTLYSLCLFHERLASPAAKPQI